MRDLSERVVYKQRTKTPEEQIAWDLIWARKDWADEDKWDWFWVELSKLFRDNDKNPMDMLDTYPLLDFFCNGKTPAECFAIYMEGSK